MSFDKLLAKVEQAEDALEARERIVAADLRVLASTWRQAVTPTRIVIAGVIAGFLAGRARPAQTAGVLGNTRWLQLASSVAGLVGALQAKFAAEGAQDAAEGAEAAAEEQPGAPPAAAMDKAAAARAVGTAADDDAGGPSARARRVEPGWDGPPVAAEAATELSEKR